MMICILKRLSVGVVMMVITIACSHEEEYVCEQMTQALSFRIADTGYQEEGKTYIPVRLIQTTKPDSLQEMLVDSMW